MTDEQKKTDTLNSIKERKDIIDKYYQTGQLDRDEAVKKIKELRKTDKNVLTVAIMQQVGGSIPLEQAPDNGLVIELENQIQLLEMKLFEENRGN